MDHHFFVNPVIVVHCLLVHSVHLADHSQSGAVMHLVPGLNTM